MLSRRTMFVQICREESSSCYPTNLKVPNIVKDDYNSKLKSDLYGVFPSNHSFFLKQINIFCVIDAGAKQKIDPLKIPKPPYIIDCNRIRVYRRVLPSYEFELLVGLESWVSSLGPNRIDPLKIPISPWILDRIRI